MTLTPWRVKRRRIDLEGVFHQTGQGNFFDDAGNARIALLHGDDVFDVIDVFGQLLQFVQSVFLLFSKLPGDLNDEFRHQFPLGVGGQEGPQVSVFLFQQFGGFQERWVSDLRT